MLHEVHFISGDDTYLYLTVDGQAYRIRWADCSPLLAHASQAQRLVFDVSPSGYGIHWPALDEDLAITPLLQHAQALEPEAA